MANDLNQCNFIGRLGRDVEMRFMPDGKAVANFSIACGWKTKNNEGAEWVNITAFDKLAEICEKYLKTGSKIFVSGRQKTEKYKDKDGIDRWTTKIIAERMQMLDSKSSSSESNSDYGDAQEQPQSRQARNAARQPASDFSDMDDDLPPF